VRSEPEGAPRSAADLPAWEDAVAHDGLGDEGMPPGAVQNEVAPEPVEPDARSLDAAVSLDAAGGAAGAVPDIVDVPATPPVPPVVDVEDLDWAAVRRAVDPAAIRARSRSTVEQLEALLDREGGPGLLFDEARADADDRVIRVTDLESDVPLWFIGDLHGDLLALESALALVGREAAAERVRARLVFLGDLFDDEGYGLEVLLRVFELIVAAPESVCFIVGNHDEALHYSGARFASTVSPSDFADFLNAHLAHEWITRAGKLAVRLFASAPRALFFSDGLLVTHGGFPLVDLHADLRATGDWNDPRCLSDFTWTRAHPRARKKIPNRTSRGSQFGYEDFAAFCEVSAELGRPVTHMVRGHDHVDDRYEIYPAYAAHPVLTTVALSRRLPREAFGSFERVPTVARWVPGALPQVYRLHVPAEFVRDVYPEDTDDPATDAGGAAR
jgi:hypothetical protein